MRGRQKLTRSERDLLYGKLQREQKPRTLYAVETVIENGKPIGVVLRRAYRGEKGYKNAGGSVQIFSRECSAKDRLHEYERANRNLKGVQL